MWCQAQCPARPWNIWAAHQLQPGYSEVLADWPKTVLLTVEGIGEVLFCHATPRDENDSFTRLTAENLLLPVFEGLNVAMVVCGHTHMQFDRTIGNTRVVNAGSVGMPFGQTGAGDHATRYILQPPSEADMLKVFTNASFRSSATVAS